MDIAPSIPIKSSSCLLASHARAHWEKILPFFQVELARFGYLVVSPSRLASNESTIYSRGLNEQIFVTLDSLLWGLSESIV